MLTALNVTWSDEYGILELAPPKSQVYSWSGCYKGSYHHLIPVTKRKTFPPQATTAALYARYGAVFAVSDLDYYEYLAAC